MRLPTFEDDHYTIDEAEILQQLFQDEFQIPELKARENLKLGDTVKLLFRMQQTPGSQSLSVERMWVEVTEVSDGYYRGTLDNDPVGTTCLQAGQDVWFQASHVIDIYPNA